VGVEAVKVAELAALLATLPPDMEVVLDHEGVLIDYVDLDEWCTLTNSKGTALLILGRSA